MFNDREATIAAMDLDSAGRSNKIKFDFMLG